MLNFLFSVSSFFSSIISWNLRDTNSWSGDMSFALDDGLLTNRVFPLYHLNPLEIFTLALKIRDMTRLGNGRVSLEFLFVMFLVKRW